MLDGFAVVNHRGIVIGALAGQNVPIIVTNRVSHEVPLTDDGIGVPAFLQKLREGLLIAVECAIAVVVEAIEVRVLAGLNNGAHGSTDGVGD